jgi:hypothetical protein
MDISPRPTQQPPVSVALKDLLLANAATLGQMLALLERFDDELLGICSFVLFCFLFSLEVTSNEGRSDPKTFGSSVGAHLRHILQHYETLTKCVVERNSDLNYDVRARGLEYESNVALARRVLQEQIKQLSSLANQEHLTDMSFQVTQSASLETRHVMRLKERKQKKEHTKKKS